MALNVPRINDFYFQDDDIQVSIDVRPGQEHRFNSDGSSKIHRPVISKKTSKDKLEATKIETKQEEKKRVPKVSVFDIIDLD